MEDKKKLSTDKKLSYILTLQQQGLSRKEIAKEMEYTRLDTLDRFMKKQGYDKIEGIYKSMEDNSRTNIHKYVNTTLEDEIKGKKYCSINVPKIMEDNSPISVMKDGEIQKKLLDIVNNYETLMDVMKWFNSGGHKEDNSTIIEINTGLQMDFEKSQVIKTTIRVDQKIWDKFGEICKSKYSHLNKHDLISKSLLDFIDKYK